MSNAMLDWARYYASLGLRVLPIKERQKSPPLVADWPHAATADTAVLSGWWQRWPEANLGVAMAAGLVDIETDVKPDAIGEQSLAEWATEARVTIPLTWSFKSGGGGIHRLFRCDGDVPNKVGVLPAVDIRGKDGYAVFPPSFHPSGPRYAWIPGCSPADLPEGPAPVPPELFFLLVEDNKAPLEVPAEIIEGHRNDMLFRLACKLRQAGLEEAEILGAVRTLNERRCDPPLEDSEVETICRQAAGYKAGALPGAAPDTEGVIMAPALMQKQFSPLIQPVQGLICEGVTLLVAASKVGKSWLALLMAICIANGTEFLGRPTTKSRVLYLALEDSERRLQERIRTLGEPVPENLYLKTNIAQLGEGFEEYVGNWLSMDSGPAVVIVDTLQKIRGVDSAGKNLYQSEYDVMGRLKKVMDGHRAAGVCLHHNNKMKQVSDPYDKISGSTALMGAADTTILIMRDRGQDTATVMYTGRDVWGDDFTIRFDNGRWSLVSNNAQEYAAKLRYEQEPLVQLFRLLLQENPGGGRWSYEQLTELGAEKLGYEPFRGGKACVAKLEKGLARELSARDGIHVTWAVRLSAKARGVEICQRRSDFVVFRRTENVEKWRVKVYSL